MGPVATIYSLASMLGDVGGALEISQQNRDWQAELDALEKCAANPTNTVSRSDPNYSSGTVAMLQAARKELAEVNSVRFLNQMAEKTADFSVTTVMSVGLKQGYAWSEQTLKNYSENTIMREARLAVVECTDPEDFEGESHLHAGRHWIRIAGDQNPHDGGRECDVGVAGRSPLSPQRNYTLPEDLNYILRMQGYQGTGGNIEGSFSRQLGGGGQESMTWSFAVSPAK